MLEAKFGVLTRPPVNLRSPKLWARVFAILLALESVGILSANLLMLRVPFLLSDERDTLANRSSFAVEAYVRMFADVFQISPHEVWVRVALSVAFAIAGLIAAWLAWRLHAWGRRAVLLIVGVRAITYVVFWAAAGFAWGRIDWDEIVWYVAAIGTFLSPPVARLYKRAPGRPSD
jgi:hypothetical protein